MTSKAMRLCLVATFATLLVPRTREARADDDGRSPKIAIRPLSTHADRVSGGDVLVEISLTGVPRKGDVIISLNGQIVTGAFRQTAPGTLVGLVTGLHLGDNRLTAEAKGLGASSLRLVNYPIAGPIVSGPHEQVGPQKRPFVCQTDTFKLPDGSTFGTAKDLDCNAVTKVTYVYLPQGKSAFAPMTDTTRLP